MISWRWKYTLTEQELQRNHIECDYKLYHRPVIVLSPRTIPKFKNIRDTICLDLEEVLYCDGWVEKYEDLEASDEDWILYEFYFGANVLGQPTKAIYHFVQYQQLPKREWNRAINLVHIPILEMDLIGEFISGSNHIEKIYKERNSYYVNYADEEALKYRH